MAGAADASLLAEIVAEIKAHGPMRFDRYMERALYDPQFGFYAGAAQEKAGQDGNEEASPRAGPAGDFVTSPTLTPLFGAALARFVQHAWERLGKPKDWWLMEAAGGTGALLGPLLEHLALRSPGACAGLRVALSDRNKAHRMAARTRLRDCGERSGATGIMVSDELPDADGFPVVMLANELLDNLPVRVLEHARDGWSELFVGVDADEGLCWEAHEGKVAVPAWLEHWQGVVPVPHRIEVPEGAFAWLDSLDRRMAEVPSVVLLIDYGLTAHELVTEPRACGTLTAFAGHGQDRDVLASPGAKDITYQVNWSAVAQHAAGLGWDVVGFTEQSRFLMDLGLLEQAATMARETETIGDWTGLQALKEVLLPGGMGERFKVMALARRLPATKPSAENVASTASIVGSLSVDWLGFTSPRALWPTRGGN